MRGNVRGMNLGLLVVVVLVMVVAGCSKDKGPTKPSVDGVAPSAVVGLSVVSPTSSSLALTWTATGDDTTVGRASQYDIRYCGVEITAANWDSVGVVRVIGEPVPGEAGSRESFVVTGLSSGTVYYFAMKVGDERPNWSGMSNVASGTTSAGGGWFALGSGMNIPVCALAEYNGRLIAGGEFATAGGVAATNIAAWDGSSWSSLGSGMNGTVLALAEYNGHLIAGGSFTMVGAIAASNIAAWDGSSWSSLGTGMNGAVYALAEYNGQLMAGGWFSTAGGVAASDIAAWDGSSWSSLGTEMNDFVHDLTVYNGGLIAGGGFIITAGGVTARRIAAWDGISWSALGTGMSGLVPFVSALAEYNGQLVAGGNFATAGGVSANGVAGWSY